MSVVVLLQSPMFPPRLIKWIVGSGSIWAKTQCGLNLGTESGLSVEPWKGKGDRKICFFCGMQYSLRRNIRSCDMFICSCCEYFIPCSRKCHHHPPFTKRNTPSKIQSYLGFAFHRLYLHLNFFPRSTGAGKLGFKALENQAAALMRTRLRLCVRKDFSSTGGGGAAQWSPDLPWALRLRGGCLEILEYVLNTIIKAKKRAVFNQILRWGVR